ncbi:PAS domain S-box protein [Arcobacter sp.]|uniref:PAS domain S-box protein n=1 Tax=Arcobacter sp. TaxID=1872629 RepID=UPI003D128C4E
MLRLLFILWIFISIPLFASQTVILKSELVEISNYPSYVKGKLTPEEALKKYQNNEFITLPQNITNSGFHHNVNWFAIELKNQDSQKLFLSMTDVSSEKVDFFKFENDKLIKIKNDFSYFIPKIQLEKTDNKELFLIKVESNVPFIIQILIGNENDILIYQLAEVVGFSIFVGILFSLFIYNIFLYFSTKENDYILYASYIICLACWIFSSHGYFSVYFQLSLILGNVLKTFFLIVNLFFLILFSLQFLNKKSCTKKLFINMMIGAVLLFFIILKLEMLDYCVGFVVLILGTLFLFYFGLQSFKDKYSPSKYYLLALGGYLIANIIFSLMFLGYLTTNFNILQSQLLGSAWLIIFLSLALGDKIRLSQIEKNEAILKSQVQEKLLFLQSQQVSLGELLGNITHQWREPLGEIGAIQTNLYGTLLIKGTLSKEKILNSIDQSSKIIKHLSNTIDVFYRLFKQTKVKNEEFDLIEEIQNIQTLIFYTLKTENIKLDIDSSNIDKTIIWGDKNEFINALLNIILNAKDIFIERKILNPWIKIKIIKKDNIVSISVEDNAGGIKFDPIHKIFDSCITSKNNSLGIGLFISYKIITERMNGRIDVQNTDNGALFTISLPLDVQNKIFSEKSIYENKVEESTLARITRLEREVEIKKETEKALFQWEEIFFQTNWGVTLHEGMSKKFKMVNPAFCSMHGYSLKEVMEKYIIDFVAKESLDFVKEKVKEAMEKSFVSFESIHKRKDGSKFPVNVDLTVIKDEQGDILYHIVNIHDITEQKNFINRLLLKKFALEHVLDAIYLIDEHSNFKYVNQGACKILNYSEEELLTLGVKDVDCQFPMESWGEHWADMKEKKSVTVISSHKTKDGKIFPVEIIANYFEYQNKSYNMAIARDISERVEMQERKEDEKMRLFFERQLVGMAITSPKKEWLKVNDKLCKMLGYTSDELQKITWDEMTHPEDLAGNIEQFNNMIEGKIEHYFYEKRFIKKDKDICFTNLSVGCIRKENGEVDYIIALIEDITKRKHIEESLIKREQELRLLADSSPGMMGSFYLKPDGTTCMPYVSPNILDIFGLEPEIVRKDAIPLLSLTHPDDVNRVNESIDESARTMTIWHEEYRIIHPIKGERWMESNTKPEVHPDGGIIWYGYVHDITERKIQEEALALKEREFRSLAANIPDNVARWDTKERYVYINPVHEKTLGVSASDIIGKTTREVFPDGSFSVGEESINKVLTTGVALFVKHPILNEDGSMGWHDVSYVPEKDESGQIVSVLGIGRDMTELTNKTIELQKALEFNEGIIAAIPDLMFDIAPDGTYINIWAQNSELLIAQKEILLGKNFKEMLPADAVETALKTLKEVDEKGFSVGNTYSLNFPDGTKWFELSASKQKSSGNYIVLSRDITERKKLEILLEKEQKFLIDAQRVSHTGSWYFDIPNNTLFWSDETYRIFELDKENINDLHKTFYECVHPDDREMVNVPYLESLKTGFPYEIEHRIVMKDGRIKYVIEKCEHRYNSDGEPLYSIGTVQDITERKKMEEQLVEQNQFLDSLLNAIPIPVFYKDTKTRYKGFNKAFEEFYGKNKEELIGKGVFDLFPREQAQVFFDADEELFCKGGTQKYEAKIQNVRGINHDVIFHKAVYFDKAGTVIGQIGTIQDITERKKMEESIRSLNMTLEKKVEDRTAELAKKEREYRTLAENLPDFLARYDKEYHRIYVNKAIAEYFGMPIEEILGTKLIDKPFVGVPKGYKEKIEYVFQTGKTTNTEVEHEKDGKKRWWNIIFTPEFDENADIISVLTIGHDITYIKQSQEQFDLLKTAINNASDALYIIGDDRSILYASDTSCKMLGYNLEEFLNMKVEDIDYHMRVEEIDNIREKVNESNNLTFKTKHRTKKGKILDVEITITKFIFNDSDLRLSIVRDITQQNRYKKEIEELNKTYEKNNTNN